MPTACCIKGCKSIWQKNSKITFHRFPSKTENCFKYWIAATGKDLVPYLTARICSLHFTHNDYFNHTNVKKKYLKPDVFPTQRVHKNIIQILQLKIDKINEYSKNDINDEQNKHIDEIEAKQNKFIIKKEKQVKGEQNDVRLINEEVEQNDKFIDEKVMQNDNILIEEQNDITSMISKCLNCEKLSIENKMLKQKIINLKKLLKELLE